ncbi:GIY-YIG nuclease family protein [Alteromonas pelagimontana]|nr:GIY-YIG nuclease family protein [Alteromonas pelagimontana]
MPELLETNCKLHLASLSGEDHPLDAYLAGKFDEFQSWQSKKNFERRYVVSLIALPQPHRWLLAGLYESHGAQWQESLKGYIYDLRLLERCSQFNGRLVVAFERQGRQSYRNAETLAPTLLIDEIRSERMSIADFPGYRNVNISKVELDTIVRQSIESWRSALSSVAGVYVISDTASGKLYIGSATGEGGLYQRWVQYAANGHGGNKELRQLLEEMGTSSSNHFRFAILEIADTHTSEKDVLRRESHWKQVLLSRQFGFNAN